MLKQTVVFVVRVTQGLNILNISPLPFATFPAQARTTRPAAPQQAQADAQLRRDGQKVVVSVNMDLTTLLPALLLWGEE